MVMAASSGLSRALDCAQDAGMGAATAFEARERLTDLRIARARILLEQRVRARQMRNGDRGAGRKVLAKDLTGAPLNGGVLGGLGNNPGLVPHVGGFPAGLWEGRSQFGEPLPPLGVEIASERFAGGVCHPR